MEQYVCTVYKAEDRGGEPFCFEPNKEENSEALISLFGQENCDGFDYYHGACDAVNSDGFWYCDLDSCTVSKSNGGYGAQIDWESFAFPESHIPAPDELVYYNEQPLSFYRESFWQQIMSSCASHCLNDTPLDNRITTEKLTQDSMYVYLKPYATNDLRIRLQGGITHDPDTGDIRVVVSDAVINPESFDYTQFTYHDSALTSKDKIEEVVENIASPKLKELIESLDTECFRELIGD